MHDVPQGIDIEQVADQPKVVEHAIHEFERSFLEALGIVLVVSFLSLGWRTGIVVALSVPLVLAITFVVMAALGIDLHRITLGALIIALGLLVDDAIIAVEMMVVKMEQGWDRMRAAAFAWTSTAFPMLTGTLVTAAGFLPIGFANSAVGEYAGGIFWVVGDRARRVLVRGGDLHALSRREAPAREPSRTRTARPARDLRDPPLPRACAGSSQACVRRRGRHGPRRRSAIFVGLDRRLRPRAAAVLPALRAAGAVLPDAPARGHGDRRRPPRRARQAEALLGDDPDIADPHDLYRPGLAALLARPQPAAAERGLRRDRDRGEGRRGARADQGAAREGGRRGRARRGAGARRPLQFRAAGRLPGAVPRRRAGPDGRCARSPSEVRDVDARQRATSSTRISTGTR